MEEDLRLFCDFGAVREQPELAELVERSELRPALADGFCRRFGHGAREHARAHHDSLREVIKDGGETRALRLVAGEHPGSRLVDILVRPAEHGHDLADGVRDAELVHKLCHLLICARRDGFQILIHNLRRMEVGDHAAEIFVGHRHGAVDEVAVDVSKFAVDGVGHQLPADEPVVFVGHGGEEIISQRVHSEDVGEVVGIQDVAF